MSAFINDMQRKLDLFETIHERQPLNSDEFVAWCELVNNNSTTLNSRRNIFEDVVPMLPKQQEPKQSKFASLRATPIRIKP